MGYTISEEQQNNVEYQQAGTAAIQAMLERSTTDRAFRDLLLTNPRAAVASFIGKSESDLPRDVDFVVVESDATATLVLPDPVNADLSDAELEMVAGGSEPMALMAIIGLTVFAIDLGIKIYNAPT